MTDGFVEVKPQIIEASKNSVTFKTSPFRERNLKVNRGVRDVLYVVPIRILKKEKEKYERPSAALLGTWLSEKYPTPESAKLKCAEATIAMVQSFPELVRIRGYAMVGVNMRPHWWCQTKEGQIVDPTAHQWDSPPVFYEPFQGTEEPHGKCYHCGELLFRSRGAQSFICADCS